jgi:hypothetical protein
MELIKAMHWGAIEDKHATKLTPAQHVARLRELMK